MPQCFKTFPYVSNVEIKERRNVKNRNKTLNKNKIEEKKRNYLDSANGYSHQP